MNSKHDSGSGFTLVTAGAQPFDELLNEVDRLVGLGVLKRPLVVQVGGMFQTPRNREGLPQDKDLLQIAIEAELIITVADAGLLCEFIAMDKPFIAVVSDRRADNPQLEFLEELSSLYDFCWICSPRDLKHSLRHARPATPLCRAAEGMNAEQIRRFVASRTASAVV